MLSRMSDRKSEACLQKELSITVRIIHEDWPFVGSEGKGRAVGLAVRLVGRGSPTLANRYSSLF